MKKKFLMGAVFLCIPLLGSAQVWITEISYNPEGSDTGLEWIEVFNGSNKEVELTEFTLRENSTNHGIKQVDDVAVLSPGEYGVIADNSDKFRTAHPQYAGTLFDSAFSLKNTGELLEIKNANDEVVFEVTYTPETGGSDNGYSIGLVGDVWFEVYQSPGSSNERHVQETVAEEVSQEEESNTATNTGTVVENSTTPEEELPATYIEIKNPAYEAKLIKVDAGGDRTVMAGVAYWFQGEVYGLQGGILEAPEVRWNWGDGSQGSGNPDRHRYLYEGVYTASMSALSGKYSARDMFTVRVIAPALTLDAIHTQEQSIYITNSSDYTLEISGYTIVHADAQFTFPVDSFITAHSTVIVPQEIHELSLKTDHAVVLQDGGGTAIDIFSPSDFLQRRLEEQIQQKQTLQKVSSTTQIEHISLLARDVIPSQEYIDYNPTHSVVYITSTPDETGDTSGSTQQGTIRPNADSQTASVIGALPVDNTYWLEVLMLCILSSVGIGGYVLYQRKVSVKTRDEYDIIE